MAEESYKSSKTRQVMNLINSSSTEINPILLKNPQIKETVAERKPKKRKETVEDKLKNYTASKRGGKEKPTKRRNSDEAIRNPSLHIPENDEKKIAAPLADYRKTTTLSADDADKKITIDINRLILDEQLDSALARFNTCGCETCKLKISELVMSSVPVKIVSAPQSEAKGIVESYRKFATKQISDSIVKILLKNKRKPFHNQG